MDRFYPVGTGFSSSGKTVLDGKVSSEGLNVLGDAFGTIRGGVHAVPQASVAGLAHEDRGILDVGGIADERDAERMAAEPSASFATLPTLAALSSRAPGTEHGPNGHCPTRTTASACATELAFAARAALSTIGSLDRHLAETQRRPETENANG
jgi:hypothetical protein